MATVEKSYAYEHGGPAVYVDTPEPRKEHHEEYIPPEERSLIQAAIRAVATAEGETYGLTVEQQLDALRFGLVQLKRVLLARNVRPDLFPLGSDCGIPCGPFKVDQPEHRTVELGSYDESNRPSFERLNAMLFTKGVPITDELFGLWLSYMNTKVSGVEALSYRQQLDTIERKQHQDAIDCQYVSRGYGHKPQPNMLIVERHRQCLRNIDRVVKPPF